MQDESNVMSENKNVNVSKYEEIQKHKVVPIPRNEEDSLY